MPELPEVETMRRGILGIVGSRILSLEWLRRPLKPLTSEPSRAVFRRRAIGQRISAVDRIGKRVVIRLESQDAIVVEIPNHQAERCRNSPRANSIPKESVLTLKIHEQLANPDTEDGTPTRPRPATHRYSCPRP